MSVARRHRRSGNAAAPRRDLRPDHFRADNNHCLAMIAQGRLAEAETALRRILTRSPGHAEAWNNLGLVHLGLGRLGEAEAAFRESARLQPCPPLALNNLGKCLASQGRVVEAAACFRHSLALEPEQAEVCNNLGVLANQTGRADEAETLLRRALDLQPDLADALCNLGLLLMGQRRLTEAEPVLEAALAMQPENVMILNNLGFILGERGCREDAEAILRRAVGLQPGYVDAWYNLGVLLNEAGRARETEACYRQALTLQPGHAPSWLNLGVLLIGLDRPQEAEAALLRALELQPGLADAHYNLGILWIGQRRLAEAETAFRAAIRLQPGMARAYNNLALLLKELRRFDEAEATGLACLHIQPGFPDAAWNLSLLYLSTGRFAAGWPLHEFRYHPQRTGSQVTPVRLPFPMWRGEELRGKALLLVPEQGAGDLIQFCRYIPLLKERGASRVSLICPAALAELLSSLPGLDRLLVEGEECDYTIPDDYWCYPLSLPLHLGTTLATIPARLPYLRAPGVARTPRAGLRVGLVWKGNPRHPNDRSRSLPGLTTLAPLWRVPGVTFVGLQKGAGEEEVRHPPPGQPLLPPDEALTDFARTAAVMSRLDLVITIDSACAHLAGALGISCWVLLPLWGTDWRWMHDRDDSPWYPGVMRLFRQTRCDAWDDVVERLAQALADFPGAGG
ncbi:MAG: tetratricopeptide repeat protein [Magnetococcales bacterium]|nr:tetratricopeptide repeat protein [Magnetococcales bacterium]